MSYRVDPHHGVEAEVTQVEGRIESSSRGLNAAMATGLATRP